MKLNPEIISLFHYFLIFNRIFEKIDVPTGQKLS